MGLIYSRLAHRTVLLYSSSSSTIEAISSTIVRKTVLRQDQFLTEKKILSELGSQHDNILSPILVSPDTDHYFLFSRASLDLCEAYIHSIEPPLSIWLPQFIEGMEFLARSSIEHYDIKPENILLFQSCRGAWRIRIADFGLARSHASHYFYGCGTIGYLAPEINPLTHLETPYVPHSMDVYGTSCMLYYLLCHRKMMSYELWDLHDYRQLLQMDHIPSVVRAGLQLYPADRPPIEDYLKTLHSLLPPPRPPRPT